MTGNEACSKIIEQVNSVIFGKEDIVKKIMTAIIGQGHILIEDIPGVGKTSMAKAFSGAMELKNNRIQFTTDVVPSDITGFSMFDRKTEEFVYKQGAVMCNLLLADEINRTSSKTQAALLEVMEEGKVTVDGKTHRVPEPFIVIATQNPIGSVGTAMLPESQLDRFMFRLTMGYPDMQEEINMILNRQEDISEGIQTQKIIDSKALRFMQDEAAKVFINENVVAYIVDMVNMTRTNKNVELGISPRGTIAIVNAAKALAYIEGRDYVVPDDVKNVFFDVANHRILISAYGRLQGVKVKDVIDEVLTKCVVRK